MTNADVLKSSESSESSEPEDPDVPEQVWRWGQEYNMITQRWTVVRPFAEAPDHIRHWGQEYDTITRRWTTVRPFAKASALIRPDSVDIPMPCPVQQQDDVVMFVDDGTYVVIPLSDTEMLSQRSYEIDSLLHLPPPPSVASDTYNALFEVSEEFEYCRTQAVHMSEMTYLGCESESECDSEMRSDVKSNAL